MLQQTSKHITPSPPQLTDNRKPGTRCVRREQNVEDYIRLHIAAYAYYIIQHK